MDPNCKYKDRFARAYIGAIDDHGIEHGPNFHCAPVRLYRLWRLLARESAERYFMNKKQECECVGVRCGAHPLGHCGKKPVQKYAFRLAADGKVMPGMSRLYCEACAKGLNAQPYTKIDGIRPLNRF